MAIHQSAIRQQRHSVRRNAINRKNKAELRTQVKKLRQAIEGKDKEAAEKLLPKTVSMIDKSVKKGSIHENKGSRYKSRLGSQVKALNPASPK
jgi:small subunit ribosomal protein S20